MDISVKMAEKRGSLPEDENSLGFGQFYTDHMFLMNYHPDQGWHDARIVPYGPLSLDPAASVLHYGQEVFEGLKAYRGADGGIKLFRPSDNFARMNASCDRLCIPKFNPEDVLTAMAELIRIEEHWIPASEGCSLYIRPFIIALDPFIGVRVAHEYLFVIILSPVSAYYPEGLDPVHIYTEEVYSRAAKGGTGEAKTSGNYAASLKAQADANKLGFTQVLWLDSAEKKYVEEVGTMNVFFVIDNEVLTPNLDGSILPGVTRTSVIDLLKARGIPVVERKISIDEILKAVEENRLQEAFGTGTAAVISPIGSLTYRRKKMILSNGEIGPLSRILYDELTGIQRGTIPDPHGWVVEI